MADKSVPVCLCVNAETHPDGDTVTFRDAVGMRDMSLVQTNIGLLYAENPDTGIAELTAMLRELYLLHFIEKWTLKDGNKPLPVTKANAQALMERQPLETLELADFADDLYAPRLVLPLVQKALNSSPTTPTNGSTSAKGRTGKSRKPSPPSSTSTTQMDATSWTQ